MASNSKGEATRRRVMSNYDFSWCRATQHLWRLPKVKLAKNESDMTGALFVDDDGNLLVRFKCDNCDGERHDTIDTKTGEVVKRAYKLPKGYLVQGLGDLRPTKYDWRGYHFRAVLNELKGGSAR